MQSERDEQHKLKVKPDEGTRSETRNQSDGEGFVGLGFSCHLVLSALGLH